MNTGLELTDAQWSTCVLGAIRRASKSTEIRSSALRAAIVETCRLLPMVEIDGLPIPGVQIGCCEFVHMIFARKSSYALFISISSTIVRVQRFDMGTQTLLVETEAEHRVNLLRMYLSKFKGGS